MPIAPNTSPFGPPPFGPTSSMAPTGNNPLADLMAQVGTAKNMPSAGPRPLVSQADPNAPAQGPTLGGPADQFLNTIAQIKKQNPGIDDQMAIQMAMYPGAYQYEGKTNQTAQQLDPGAFLTPAQQAAANDPKTSATTPTPSPDDAITMGLGMFFKQYLTPLLNQQSQANSSLIANYGNAMNQALQNPLPPGIKSILSATTPQQQGLMQMLNQSGSQAALGMGPFEQLMQQVGGESQAYQALTDILTKAAGSVALYGGGMGSYAPLLQQLFPQGSLGAAAAQAMTTSSATPGIGTVGGIPTTPTTGTTTAPNQMTAAQWLALTPQQQQALTQTGFTPPLGA